MPIKSGRDWSEKLRGTRVRHARATPSRGQALVPGIHVFPNGHKNMDGRDKPGHDADGEGTRRALQTFQQILRAGNLRFARRILDVERLHNAVVHYHGVALRARAEAAFPEVDREADRLRESRAAVGEKLDLAGRAGV